MGLRASITGTVALLGTSLLLPQNTHAAILETRDQVTFTDVGALPQGVWRGAVAWGDYDNDGDLDVVLSGEPPESGELTFVMRNDGGTFRIASYLTHVNDSAAAWGDYDGDGDLDVLLTGYSASGAISRVYRNTVGHFADIGAGLPGAVYGSVAWGDYDNDGDLDILLSGIPSQPRTRVYRNDAGAFADVGAGLPSVSSRSAAWGDYDHDGDLDILLVGQSSSGVYRNDAGTFVDAAAGLPNVTNGYATWGDYDNDGDLDIVLAGYTTERIARVYRNDGHHFADIGAGLTGVSESAVAWGDYDNDGDLDLVLMGGTGTAGTDHIARVYRNDMGAFVDIEAGLLGVTDGALAWGDYDNDGDLDLLMMGLVEWGFPNQPVARVYRSDGAAANTAPTVPSGLTAQLGAGQVTLSWAACADAQTPGPGLSYNLRIGSTSGGNEVCAAMADVNGYRRVVQLGNAQERTSWRVFVPPGSYYWSVQAVDGAFAGSQFAEEHTFDMAVGVSSVGVGVPTRYALYPSAPNPFGPATTVRFDLRSGGRARLEIFNIMGERVRMLVNEEMESGRYSAVWDGRDRVGVAVAPGVYVVRLEAGSFAATRKVVRTR